MEPTVSTARSSTPTARGPYASCGTGASVPETEHPVVVRELDVPVEDERAQVRVVVEAVALKPRIELELAGEANDEEGGEEQRTAPQSRAPRKRDRCHRDRHCDDPPGIDRPAAKECDDRPARHFAAAQFRRGRRDDGPRGDGDQGSTFMMRSSGPGRSRDGVNRTSSRDCSKIVMYAAYSLGNRCGFPKNGP